MSYEEYKKWFEENVGEKLTAQALADWVYDENGPIDWGWIRHIRRTEGYEGLRDLARATIEDAVDACVPEQMIGRAATLLADRF